MTLTSRLAANLALAAVTALALPACDGISTQPADATLAQQHIVADFRTQPPSRPTAAASESHQAVINAVYGDDAPTDIDIAGTAHGAFTAPHVEQALYLLVRGAPVPAGPQGRPAMVAVLHNGSVVAQFVMSAAPYRNVIATVDADADGVLEVLLSASTYQMGTNTTTVHQYSFSGGEKRLLETYKAVIENSCDAPGGNGEVRASVLLQDARHSAGSAKLKREDFVEPCVLAGGPNDESSSGKIR